MEVIIAFNNKGCQYCQSGDFDNAFACFRNATMGLRLLREKNSSCYHDCHCVEEYSNKKCIDKYYNPIQGWSEQLRPRTIEGEGAIVFSRMIIMNQYDSINYAMASSRYKDIVALSLMYNLGLLHHLQSDSTVQNSKAIEATYHAYKQAILISQKFEKTECTIFPFDLEALRMALINNMGALYNNNICQYRDAIRCFRSWRRHMDILEAEFVHHSLMTPEEILQFSMNMLIVPIAASPAA
mmetsp:Transcript_11534/g.16924  ORF Transcript_11534/g.16924 Transcript_11534/m.16924 type:complete len:240 (+) Transcript_11534:118-837(+)